MQTQVKTTPAVLKYFNNLIDILYENDYFGFEEDATRVANVNVNDNDNCYYDLQGRCVSNGQWSIVNRQSLKKGLYIVNGKKIVIK